MARAQTTVQLTDELVRQLDEEAARRGTSRSSLIRAAIEAHLAASSERVAVERLVAACRAVPPPTPDVWGEVAHAGDVATAETMQRVDAEEAAAGFQPW